MAKSRFSYVKKFESEAFLLPETWLVVRVDGRRFTRFSKDHKFEKPNDITALNLMNECAKHLMNDIGEILFAYGQSDEFSFVLSPSCQLYNRRASKIETIFTSLFSSCYTFFWPKHFQTQPLLYPPCFDGRVICYPAIKHVRDYLSWRQADCHINNLYNTCFWALVQQGGMSQNQAQAELKGTVSSDKNELLFSRFGINYNTTPQICRKGSIIFRKEESGSSEVNTQMEPSLSTCNNANTATDDSSQQQLAASQLVIQHVDIIQDEFWSSNSHILNAS